MSSGFASAGAIRESPLQRTAVANPVRESARQALHLYMARTGLGLPALAERTGFALHSLRQFSSLGRYGDGEGEHTAAQLMAFFAANPAPLPELPGRLYETQSTREMDRLLRYVARGRWGTLYGPAGAQKSFLLEYRAAQAAQREQTNLICLRTSPAGMSPNVLLRRIGAALAAPYAQYLDGIRQAVLYKLRQRRGTVSIVLDEAQHLYSRIDTLETLRELGDVAGARVGILLAGNERVLDLFEPRRHIHFEQWRSRIEQEQVRVLGPSREEGRRIVPAERPGMSGDQVEAILEGCMVADPVSKRKYVNARRLFNTLRDLADEHGQTENVSETKRDRPLLRQRAISNPTMEVSPS